MVILEKSKAKKTRPAATTTAGRMKLRRDHCQEALYSPPLCLYPIWLTVSQTVQSAWPAAEMPAGRVWLSVSWQP